MGLRLVDVFRSVLEELVTGRGGVLIEPMDLCAARATPDAGDLPPPACIEIAERGLVAVPA